MSFDFMAVSFDNCVAAEPGMLDCLDSFAKCIANAVRAAVLPQLATFEGALFSVSVDLDLNCPGHLASKSNDS